MLTHIVFTSQTILIIVLPTFIFCICSWFSSVSSESYKLEVQTIKGKMKIISQHILPSDVPKYKFNMNCDWYQHYQSDPDQRIP